MRKLLSITRIIWILWILYIFCWYILTLICRRENGTLQITYIGIVVFTIIETVTINPDFIKKTINPTIKGIIPIRLNIIYVIRMIILRDIRVITIILISRENTFWEIFKIIVITRMTLRIIILIT